MKLSVSIPEEDVAFLDAYARNHKINSRSATLQQAIRLLRAADSSADYAQAFSDWSDDGNADAWDVTTTDGLSLQQ